MVSAAKSRLNYYEMLGVSPTAASDAITSAFSKATNVLRPHVFGGITELCVAYETLRDPVRRRAYDASIGLAPKPTLPPPSRPASAHFMVRPVAAAVAPPRSPSQAPEPPSPAARVEPQPARPEVPLFTTELPGPSEGVSPIEWKRSGAILGGLIAAAVLVGGIGGWWSVSEANPDPAAPAESIGRAPKPKAPTVISSNARQESALYKATERFESPRHVITTQSRAKPVDRRAHLAASQAEAELIQPPSDLADQPAITPLAPATDSVPVESAALPLPHKTVARTIDRIGYSCGNVASASPVEGAAGVFTITCTSGQSFQARPVRGRYRFKRLARD